MNAVIVSIGTEITNGRNLDTNSQWLSIRLSELGIPVAYHVSISDDLEGNITAFRRAIADAQLVLTTGGLGPTADDLTREAVARLAEVELVLDEPSLGEISSMFARRGRPMPERNRLQAYKPSGAEMIPNAEGTAPGLWMQLPGSIIACLPGVPREMYAMYTHWLAPRIAERFGGGRATVFRTLRTFGAGESHIEERLGGLIQRGRDPEIGITTSEATITLRIVSHGATPAEATAKAEPDVAYIRERLGDLVYGEGDEQLETVVGNLLKQKGLMVASAESCTGGLLGHLLTQTSGSSDYYLGGLVVYSNEAKITFADVPKATIDQYGAVSPEVAEALAEGVRRKFGADLGVGITGIAGPGGGSPEKPVGLVYIGVAGPNGVQIGQYNWPGDRHSIKWRSAKCALNLLRLYLLGRTPAEVLAWSHKN